MATILLLGAAYTYYKDNNPDDPDASFELDEGLELDNKQIVRFLPHELQGIRQVSITTATFCKGNYKLVAPKLEERVKEIRRVNPWLGGFLAPDKDSGQIQLFYDETRELQSPPSFRLYEPSMQLTQDTPIEKYDDISDIVKVPTAAVGRNVPLWKVTLIPDASAPVEKFILVVSMAYVLGDSCTFYALYNSMSTPAKTLNPVRKEGIQEQAVSHLGEAEMNYLQNVMKESAQEEGSSDGGGLKNLFRQSSKNEAEEEESPQEVLIFRVSKRFLMQLRGFHPEVKEDSSLLVSWFFKKFQPEVAMISYSLRGVLPALEELDAGIYHRPVPLTARDYRRPQDIQESMSTGRRSTIGETQLPLKPESFSVAADWSRFGEVLRPTDNVEQTHHFPLVDKDDVNSLSRNTTVIVVFQASLEGLGALCVVPKDRVEEVRKSGIYDTQYVG